MNTYNVFNCQFKAVQLSLGRECCLSGKEALAEVMNKDFQEVKWNFLSDPDLNAHYHHEYENTKQKDIFMMRVANKRVYPTAKDFIEDDSLIRFPYLYVILDCRQETPTVMIEDYKEVSSSLDEIADVLTFSINKAMKAKGWKVKLVRAGKEMSPLPFSLRTVMEPLLDKPRTIEEFHGVDNMCELYKKKRKQEPADFRNAIKYSAKVDQIIAVLKQMMEGKTQARDIIRPIRAAMDIGLIRRPTFREFIETFHPEVHIAKSTFSDYTNPDNAPFVGDDLYDNIKEELLTI